MSTLARLWSHTATLTLTVFLSLHGSAVTANVLSVTNYGADNNNCGSTASPCRSITQAIENASAWDTIWVGAGHYGNIHGDPDFSGAGDERPQTLPIYHTYSSCMICVTKPVHIQSYNGAAVTFIDGGSSPLFTAAVMIVADGATFGSPGHGFTITGGNGVGVLVNRQLAESMTRDTVVAGNIDVKDGFGFLTYGMEAVPFQCPPQFAQDCFFKPNAQVLLLGNQALGSGVGFYAIQNFEPTGHIKFVMQGNLAAGTKAGFAADGGIAIDVRIDAPVATYLNNVAVDNGVGFSLPYTGTVRGNTASGNSQAGFLLETTSTLFVQNSAIGNAGPGAIVAPGDPNRPPAVIDQFYGNNFFGNDRNRPQITVSNGPLSFPLGPGAQCGVVNVGAFIFIKTAQFGFGGLGIPETLQAPNNFWGSAHGPQQNGQGDAAGGVCDFNGGTTIAKPAQTAPAAITSF